MSNNKVAFITGITGMDGSYLAEFLIEKGYLVHGLIRRTSLINTKRLNDIYQIPEDKKCKLFLHYGDITDTCCLYRLIHKIKPDEVYNLASMSNVRVSFDDPVYTSEVDGIGTIKLLEACKSFNDKIKFYQAGTSDFYGGVYKNMQNELTPFYPRSPYAIAKLYSYWTVRNYRESYGMFTVNGILFNHTSPRRDSSFVEQKIVKGAIAIAAHKQECLYLGNLYTYRDFGHSKDFVEAMWLMLQQDSGDDYVIATGEKHLIKNIVNKVFEMVGINLDWYGSGKDEYATWDDQVVIRIDPRYYRPIDTETLHGDFSKAKEILGWSPKYNLDMILKEMIEYEKSKDKYN